MGSYQCIKCGGSLTPSGDERTAICEWCGSVVPVPKVDSGKFNQANRLRMEQQFDLAAAAFQDILAEKPTDSESYWNLLLCRYGIEYVEDVDGSRIPTCHRMSYDSILEDEDYKNALKYADGASYRLYQSQAAEIDRKLKEIIAIARTQQDYDVFISYKEEAPDGGRTDDSVIGQTIYEKLTDRGFRVFFSRVSLEKMAGQDYEPVIFSALQSAKLMIVIGTKPEYVESAWVKNEWSRYRALMNREKGRHLVIVYRDMLPEDFPKEFALHKKQAVNAGLFGYEQDLATGVEKLIGSKREAASPGNGFYRTPEELRLVNFISRGEQELASGSYDRAREYFEKAMDIEPKSAKAWWGLFRVRTKNLTCMELDRKEPFDKAQKDARDFAMEYANAEEKREFEAELARYEQEWQEQKAEKLRQKNDRKVQEFLQKLRIDTREGGYFLHPYEREGALEQDIYRIATEEQKKELDSFWDTYEENYEKYQEMQRKKSQGYLEKCLEENPEYSGLKEETEKLEKKQGRAGRKAKNIGILTVILPFLAVIPVLFLKNEEWCFSHMGGDPPYIVFNVFLLLAWTFIMGTVVQLVKGGGHDGGAVNREFICLGIGLIPAVPLTFGSLYLVYKQVLKAKPGLKETLPVSCVFYGGYLILIVILVILVIVLLFANLWVGIVVGVIGLTLCQALEEKVKLTHIQPRPLASVMDPWLMGGLLLLGVCVILRVILWISSKHQAKRRQSLSEQLRIVENKCNGLRESIIDRELEPYWGHLDVSYLKEWKNSMNE